MSRYSSYCLLVLNSSRRAKSDTFSDLLARYSKLLSVVCQDDSGISEFLRILDKVSGSVVSHLFSPYYLSKQVLHPAMTDDWRRYCILLLHSSTLRESITIIGILLEPESSWRLWCLSRARPDTSAKRFTLTHTYTQHNKTLWSR